MIQTRTLRGVSIPVIAAMLMSTVAVQQAEARNGFAIAAGAAVLGLVAGSAIAAAAANKNRPQARQPRQRVVVVREQPARPKGPTKAQQIADANRANQRALAALGLYDGPVDGTSSPATKAAILQFQGRLNEKPTGQLTSNQRRVLMANYAASLNNKAPSQPNNGADPLFAALGAGAATAAGAGAVGVVGTINSQGAVNAGGQSANPPFFRGTCEDGGGGRGLLTLAAATEGSFAKEQFCVGRQALLVESSETLAGLGQVDIQAVRQECRRIAESMSPKIAMLATDTPAALSAKLTKEFAGAAAQRMSVITNFKVCLGVGYVEDAPEVILAASLGLVGNGLGGYGEAIAGVLGIGKEPYSRPAKSAEWLDFSAQQVEKGSPPVKTELGPERSNILRSTAEHLRGKGPRILVAAPPAQVAPAPQQVAAAPVFTSESARPAAAPAAPAEQPAASAPVAPTAAVAVAPTPTLPAANTAADAKAAISSQAVAFFTAEITEQTRRLDTLVVTLGLDKANLPTQCAGMLAPDAKDDAMMLRVCRSWSYSVQNKPQMYAFDQKLARSGDADAASRVLMHVLVGNDRAQ